jgi:hypothetical protein
VNAPRVRPVQSIGSERTGEPPGFRDAHPRVSLPPKLVECLAAGYSRADFRADVLAGITVGVVALPLAMAFRDRVWPDAAGRHLHRPSSPAS